MTCHFVIGPVKCPRLPVYSSTFKCLQNDHERVSR